MSSILNPWRPSSIFVIGDGEEAVAELVGVYREWKMEGSDRKASSKGALFQESMSWLLRCRYHADGTVNAVRPNRAACLSGSEAGSQDLDAAVFPINSSSHTLM